MNRRPFDDDRGSISMFMAVLAVSFLLVAGLALDGGRKLGALSQARDLADNAARAGAQKVDTEAYRATGQPTVDAEAASQAVDELLALTGNSGVVSVEGDIVTVTVDLKVETVFLPGPFEVSATESAQAVVGVDGPR